MTRDAEPATMSFKHILLAILVTAIWGFNFTVIHWGLGDMPPMLLSAMRFLVAALPAVFFFKRPKISWGSSGGHHFFSRFPVQSVVLWHVCRSVGGHCLDRYSVAGFFYRPAGGAVCWVKNLAGGRLPVWGWPLSAWPLSPCQKVAVARCSVWR